MSDSTPSPYNAISKQKIVATRFFAFIFVLLGLGIGHAYKAKAQVSWMQMLTTGTRVWSVACAECTWKKSFHQETIIQQPWSVSSVVWSSDGRYLAVGSGLEGTFNVYDTKGWTLISNIQRWDIGSNNSLVRFSDQNTTLILPRIWGKNAQITAPTIDDNVSLEKWDIKLGIVTQKYYAHFPGENDRTFAWRRMASIARAIAVSSDGQFIAAAVGGEVLVYNATSGSVVQGIMCGPSNVPEALAFSPDSQVITAGNCGTHKISTYEIKTGEMIYQTVVDPGSELYNAISYNQSGNLIAVGSSSGDHGTVTILQAMNGSILGVLPNSAATPSSMSGENATVTNLQWIDNDHVLASYDAWNPDGSVARVWDVHSLHLVGEIGGNHLQMVAISPDGSRLAAVFEKNVVIGDIK